MNRKIRYSILGLGGLAFLILAPLIILYVKGVSYDFKNGGFVSTGILALRTEPKSLEVFLDNKLAAKASGDLQFLSPGEYEVSLKKDGYFPWHKRLAIKSGQVTWASPPNGKIHLLLDSQPAQTLATGTLDFFANDRQIVYLTSNDVTLASWNDISQKRNFALPKKVTKILASDSAQNFIFGNNDSSSIIFFNSNLGTFTDLSGLFKKAAQWQFSQDGRLFALSDETVYEVLPGQKTTVAVLAKVKAFYGLFSDLYAVQSSDSGNILSLTRGPFVESQQLLSGLPNFKQGQLFVTSGKRIFLLADGGLYQAGETIQKVSDNITSYNFDNSRSTLQIFHAGEFSNYNLNSQTNDFVTRSSQALQNLRVNQNYAYAFYQSPQGLSAIELDTRDNQNQYLLYSGQQVEKFEVNDAMERVLFIDGTDLKILKIR